MSLLSSTSTAATSYTLKVSVPAYVCSSCTFVSGLADVQVVSIALGIKISKRFSAHWRP